MNEWISVEDSLPPSEIYVLVIDVNCLDLSPWVKIAWIVDFDENKPNWISEEYKVTPTHWMHLPPIEELITKFRI